MERMFVCNEEVRIIYLFTSNKNQNSHKVTAGRQGKIFSQWKTAENFQQVRRMQGNVSFEIY